MGATNHPPLFYFLEIIMLFGELTQQHINWFLALIHDKDLNTWDPCNNWDHGGPLIEMWEVIIKVIFFKQ